MKDENGQWLEPELGKDLSEDTGRHFKKEPAINVIPKEEFEERVEKVFHLLWKTLSKSFGPYGAPTLICNYPYQHVTKDGYTIMKNLSMDASETLADQAISDMASDICGRLNYAVGDGTTSAIIATNSIYQNYRLQKEELDSKFILPRDIIYKYDAIKNDIINKLHGKITQIRTEDMDVLKKNIHDVVYISSNGDEEMTENISELYRNLGAPAISCSLASDGVTKSTMVEGYQYDITLNDKLYINTDNETMDLTNTDVIIFSTKITKNTYEKILKPLNMECKMRKRHLIVASPFYDEMALSQVIARDLNTEYQKTHDVNMVLMTYRAISAHTRKLVEDFAVLMNTTVIDHSIEMEIYEKLSTGANIFQVLNIDNRDIDGIDRMVIHDAGFSTYTYGVDELPENVKPINDEYPLVEGYVDLGFVKTCSLGLKTSLFKDLIFDDKRYEVVLKDAEQDLKEKEDKYKKLGTFNIEVSLAQQRLYALRLKMGIIEVGADSELSQKMIKDSVDDAIRAAASAFNHGVVLGCNTNLVQVIDELRNEDTNATNKILLNILLEGFLDVYRTVLKNAFTDVDFKPSMLTSDYSTEGVEQVVKDFKEFIDSHMSKFDGRDENFDTIFTDNEAVYESVKRCLIKYDGVASVHNIIIYYSIITNQVFDVSSMKYSSDVINSAQTDEEILKATIDLITLLITGNQMVITQKHNF